MKIPKRIRVLTAAILAGTVSFPAIGGCTDQAPPAQSGSVAAPGPDESAKLSLDERYRRLLETSEALAAVWRQQPENVAVLRGYAQELQLHIRALREQVSEREETPSAAPGGSGVATGTVGPPEGPVAPSSEPSSEEAIRRREEATERFLTRELDEWGHARSLEEVPSGWITQALASAEEHLGEVDQQFTLRVPDPVIVESSLRALQAVLRRVDNPPGA